MKLLKFDQMALKNYLKSSEEKGFGDTVNKTQWARIASNVFADFDGPSMFYAREYYQRLERTLDLCQQYHSIKCFDNTYEPSVGQGFYDCSIKNLDTNTCKPADLNIDKSSFGCSLTSKYNTHGEYIIYSNSSKKDQSFSLQLSGYNSSAWIASSSSINGTFID